MSQVSNGEIALDRASNIKIFEKLATPHMVDTHRIEALKQFNAVSDLPIGRAARSRAYTVEDDNDRDDDDSEDADAEGNRSERDENSDTGARSPQVHPVVAMLNGGDNDSLAAILRDGMRRASPSERSEPSTAPSSPVEEAVLAAMRAPSRESRRHSAQSQSRRHSAQSQSRRHSAQSTRSLPSPPGSNMQAPPMLPEMDEFARIRASTSAGPSLDSMRQSYQARKTGAPPPPAATGDSAYMQTFRNLCQSRRTVLEGDSAQSGGYKPHKDPDYSEKRELLVKLDEMRSLGFNVPRFDLCMPLEDLQSELARRTVSQGTVSTVETMIGWICTAASIIETVNSMAGPFLPMENYSQQVKEGTSTPRFKYAMYQLVLRWSGRNSGSPWRVILLVLLMPLVQGVLIKACQWLAKGRLPIQPSQISSGVRSLFNMAKGNPNDGVPTGIPGISSDMPKPQDAPVVPPTFGGKPPVPAPKEPVLSDSIPNPFAERYPKAKVPPQKTPAPASTNEPVQRKRRPRLQRPNEVMSDAGSETTGFVVTPDTLSRQ